MAARKSSVFPITSVIEIAERIGELAKIIHPYEGAKVDKIYYHLIAENAKIKRWTNQLQDQHGDNSLSSIEPADVRDISLLIGRLERYHGRLEMYHRKYEIIKAISDKGGQPFVTTRGNLKLPAEGFDDLREMTYTMAAMNEALRAIMPVKTADDGDPPISNLSVSYPSGDPRPGSERVQSLSSTTAPVKLAAQPLADDMQPVPISIRIIWQQAVEGLAKIAIARKEKRLEISAGRLKLWGVGLFEDRSALDDVLVSRSRKNNHFHHILVRTFTDILLLEEREIRSITTDESHITHRGLLQVKSEIGALFSTDELVGYAIEDWSSQLALSQKNTDMDQTARTKMHAQHDAEKTDIALARAVENLFDFLPGIRAERHAYCYDNEVSGEHRTHQKATAESGGTNFPVIREQYEGVKSVIASREDIFHNEERSDILEPTLAKRQAHLEERQEKGKRTTKLATDEKSAGDLREEMEKAFVTRRSLRERERARAQMI